MRGPKPRTGANYSINCCCLLSQVQGKVRKIQNIDEGELEITGKGN
jgi:hypothetical protein